MALSITQLVPVIPLAPLAGALVNGLLGARLPRRLVSFVACASVLVALICSALVASQVGSGGEGISVTLYSWIHAGNVAVDLRLLVDHLSAVMILVVTGVGFLIHVYSIGYMAHEPSLARYFAYLNLFTFAMLVLVLGDSLPVMFVGWEGVGLCSYLLIGFWYTDSDKASAGRKAFIVNRIGDFGFIIAMLILVRATGTLTFDGLRAAVLVNAVSGVAATAACLLLVLGATGKSAQIPLYVWLPDAMVGPTPVSALIHAATMVTAGVYMTARLGFLFDIAPVALLTLATIGAVTALFAASIATAQNDIKKVLAYSTISQLGFMFIAAGVGAYAAAIFHLVTHSFFKACLFLGAGSVIHALSGEQDLRQMGGLFRRMPLTAWTFLLATLAITGVAPGLSGFISKDAILWHAFVAREGVFASTFGLWALVLWALGVVAAGFTSFYMWRLFFLAFFSGELRQGGEAARKVHESPLSMTIPLIVLAALATLGGALAWPQLLGGSDRLSGWLLPAVGVSPSPEGEFVGLEVSLMVVALAAAGLGLALAATRYLHARAPQARGFKGGRLARWLHAGMRNRWYVDELYDTVLVKPVAWVSRVVVYEGLERRVIDGVVNLVGALVKSVGFLGQVLQSGNIQRYLAVFVIGLALLIYTFLAPAKVDNAKSAVAPAASATEQVFDGAGE